MSHARASLLAALALAPSAAAAQPEAGARVAQAEFRRGVTALTANRPAEAAAALEASYAAYPSPVALYNLALARRALGQRVRAIAAFERYVREESAAPLAARRAAIDEAVRAMRAELATVRLTVSAAPYAVLVDGEAAALEGDALVLDPGEHALVVRAPEHLPARVTLSLAAGEALTRELTLRRDAPAPPPPAPPAAATPPAVVTAPPVARAPTPHPAPSAARPTAATPLTSRWWFWAGLGAVVVAGVAATVVIARDNPSVEPPVPGLSFDVVTGR